MSANSAGRKASGERRLVVAASPHVRSPVTVKKIMWAVVIALLPALGGSVYFFGLKALWLVALSVVSAVVFDTLAQLAFGRKLTPADGSAVITGLLLAYNLPPGVSWWVPVVGAAFAMIVVKQFFGGLGHNFINPALAARAFLVVSWPTQMTSMWLAPQGGSLSGLDAVSGATPLALVRRAAEYVSPDSVAEVVRQANSMTMLKRLFLGNVGGCLGETSALLLLIGAALLIAVRVIDWRIPAAYLGTVLGLSLILPANPMKPWFHLFSGGIILGAFFMATDYVTSPVTAKGRVIFGIGCGIITMLIRLYGGYPEGCSYSILLMNVATPLIDRFTRPRLFGALPRKKK
ncbi:MAG: RnfABCDGE type electron transport complex subunit D [candidate division WOR-3 bacterium]